jgi:NADH:ubiquinone oxidoreductase subunit E
MSFVPGLGIAKGMALTLRRFFAPKATIQYPEAAPDIAVRFRGRLQLLYDEAGNLKCETCFQCAQACPVECIDMGGFDTMGRFHVHWGEAEQYGERREESALRRSGRPVPDPAYSHFAPVDVAAVDRIAAEHDYDRKQTLQILESIQAEYGYLPVAALKRYSQVSGAAYALLYGTASYYRHLHLEESGPTIGICGCPSCALAGGGQIARALALELGTEVGRKPENGRPALEYLPIHSPGTPSPLIALDGVPQEVTRDDAVEWVRALAAGTAGAARASATRPGRAAGTGAGTRTGGPGAAARRRPARRRNDA